MKIRKAKVFALLFTVVLSASFYSCGNNSSYDQMRTFEDQTWNKGDVAKFEVEVNDIQKQNHFFLTLRTSRDYMYSNLWLYIDITSPDGTTSTVAEKLPLANPDGSWIGNVSGSIVETIIPFAAKKFPMKGTYVFKLRNATSNGDISGVLDIALRIE